MTAQTQLFDYIKSLAGLKFSAVLPQGEGYAAQLAPGSEDRTFLDGGKECTMSVLFLGKGKDQKALMDRLNGVCNTLTAKRRYAAADGYEIRCINTATMPNYVCKDGDMWVWSCIIDVHYLLT